LAEVTRALVFVGFMGAGKTTAARAAGAALGIEAPDTDELLAARLGMPIARFFDERGEAAFRAEEEALVVEMLDGTRPNAAIALGGGSVLSARVREALAAHTVVWLEVDADEAWERVAGGDRPLARDRGAFGALLRERTPLYAAVADAIVPGALDREVAAVVPWLAALQDAPRGTRMVVAASASAAYPVYVGEGTLAAGFYPSAPGRRFMVTDGRVPEEYRRAVEPVLGRAVIMPGEASKTLAHAEIVWTEMVRAGLTREDHVTAVGGGVVGDLGGFCAAAYQRGIPVVQVPTTLVAQVDSAYGGKTGVDLAEAKNYVGAYHQPAAVLTDPATLRTLPAEELAAGYAEVVKTALVAGGELWERISSRATDGADAATVLACARLKLAVVAEDERDGGRRQVLNLGHTVAHGIEAATGYARYRHGEAVGLGLLAALRLSGLGDLRAEVAGLLGEQGLSTRLDPDVDLDAVELAIGRDKKRRGEGPVPFVLVQAPGDVRHGQPVEPDALRAALEELAG
jgi:shikimate kinase/3-dehydroquinate synthase